MDFTPTQVWRSSPSSSTFLHFYNRCKYRAIGLQSSLALYANYCTSPTALEKSQIFRRSLPLPAFLLLSTPPPTFSLPLHNPEPARCSSYFAPARDHFGASDVHHLGGACVGDQSVTFSDSLLRRRIDTGLQREPLTALRYLGSQSQESAVCISSRT